MNLPIKYRPVRFDQIVGQSVAVEIAKASLIQPEIQTTFLLVGASGSGKTTLARIIARSLNCTEREDLEPCNQCSSCQDHLEDNHLAISEINGADKNGVDDVREIIEKCQLNTVNSKYRVFIIDECHQMSKPAQNAMLKLLEDPPQDTVFLLCTTEEDKLLETIRSRARILRFPTVDKDSVVGYLLNVAYNEQIPLSDEQARLIYNHNQGSIRQCLQTLGTVSPHVTVEDLCPEIDESALQEFLLAFDSKDFIAISTILETLVKNRFYPKQILTKLIDYIIDLMGNPQIQKGFIVCADKALSVMIPAVTKLGNSNNAQLNCRLTLYSAALAWSEVLENVHQGSAQVEPQPQLQSQPQQGFGTVQPQAQPQPQPQPQYDYGSVNLQPQHVMAPQPVYNSVNNGQGLPVNGQNGQMNGQNGQMNGQNWQQQFVPIPMPVPVQNQNQQQQQQQYYYPVADPRQQQQQPVNPYQN